jgi:hypothetical protein
MEQADMDFKPNLHQVHKIIHTKIVGEYRSSMSIFTNFVLAGRFVMVYGPRASGKTYISEAIRDFFLGDMEKKTGTSYSMTMGSDKAPWYQIDLINQASHIFIFELNQVPKDFMEIIKRWGEDKTATYKTTISKGGARTVKPYRLEPRPVTFCLADEQYQEIGDQLSSRLTVIRTDSSISQNKAIMFDQAKRAKIRKMEYDVSNDTIVSMKDHIFTMPEMKNLLFKHPAADKFIESIPPFWTDCRRDFPKYLWNTYGITRFHWKERIRAQQGKDKFLIFVTPQDMYSNHIIYGKTLIDSSLKCNETQRDIIEILKKQETNEMFKLGMKTADVQRFLRGMGNNVSTQMTTRYLNDLSNIGYLVKDEVKKRYITGDLFNEFKFQINWKEVLEETKQTMLREFPEAAPAYIKKYIDDDVVLHPFSGKKVKLSELEVMKVDAMKKDDLSSYFKEEK